MQNDTKLDNCALISTEECNLPHSLVMEYKALIYLKVALYSKNKRSHWIHKDNISNPNLNPKTDQFQLKVSVIVTVIVQKTSDWHITFSDKKFTEVKDQLHITENQLKLEQSLTLVIITCILVINKCFEKALYYTLYDKNNHLKRVIVKYQKGFLYLHVSQ